jgi:hypothetical protein
VLFLNVSAGIGMIGMASPMLQEVFAGSLIGRPDISFTHLNDEQRRMVATIGTLVLTVFGHLDFSLRVGTTGSHVPYKSPFRLRAAYMPDVARAVFRTTPQLIRGARVGASAPVARCRRQTTAWKTRPRTIPGSRATPTQ